MQTVERSHYADEAHLFRRVNRQDTLGSNGTLVIIGGGAREASLKAVVDHLPPPQHLTIATLASPKEPEYQYEKCSEGMKQFGIVDPFHLSQDFLTEERDSYLPPETSGVFVTGGYQDLLMERLSASLFGQELRDFHANGGTVIGTSAGASFMGKIMPLGNSHLEGFGLVPHIIDQHFTQGNRKGRLTSLVQRFPDRIGIGIDENTAVVYQNEQMHVMGEGQVYVLSKSGRSSIDEVVLSEGDVFDLSTINSYAEIAAG